MTSVRVAAPAKVNLRLRVMAREDSGYHQLETLFQALEFGDSVDVEPRGSGVHLAVHGPAPCPPEDNLAYRAAALYLGEAGIAQGVSIALRKVVPAGGGLGGGSSDAAAVLKALDALYEAELGAERLSDLARGLGADVPFFLARSPLALAWGRGDRFLTLPSLPAAPVLLCLPDVHVSTPDAFSALARQRDRHAVEAPAGALEPDELASWQSVSAHAVNDFHGPVFELHPELEALHATVAGTEPTICLLSGSGSAIFAVYEHDQARDRAIESVEASAHGPRCIATTTRTDMPAAVG